MEFQFHPEARDELDDAIAWYEERRPGAGRTLRQAVEYAISLLCKNPYLGSAVPNSPYRRWTLRKVQYIIYYEDRGDVLQVMAVAHARRRPGYWMKRRRDENA